MTPAEFKTIRESLGLTAQWIADNAGVKLRTAQYWEAGRMAVPVDVVNMLDRIDRTLEFSIAQALDQVAELAKQQGTPAQITLVRYRTDAALWQFRPDMKPLPATTHAAMLSRLRRALWSRGIPTVIQYMEPEEYETWLAGRPDTEVERAAWAATLQER
ncbi:Aca2/YdiL-like domain-containing protein [Parachitinimonas caeni]|uniref:DUF1870 family protein n=1 Tax=Parachitinimonas caeni TaxID=3031301 RepID=A0ABT7E1Q5_9NEIS|nr:DUF1870 family protein [Parachitinimonas caeni]MDK2126243.1 DUF1870 family protein [Parachitinimonas caeni]